MDTPTKWPVRQVNPLTPVSLRFTLSEFIDPMDPDSHPAGALINTGAIAITCINIDDSVTLGQEQLELYASSLPESFYNSIKQHTITFSDTKKARLWKLETLLPLTRKQHMLE